ncbi:MAG: hypothetical protein KAH33_06865 [Candidatus Delongbacteria bacterium]|nr:hypothetical protein [Candidatus Delongbacteria bacterium]
MKDILRHQVWHLLFLLISIAAIQIFLTDKSILVGELCGISTKAWFWIAIAVPIIHQVYVLVIWRLELYHSTFAKRFGLSKAFKMYAIGFSILFVSRLIFLTLLALSDRNSLSMNPLLAYSIIAVIIPLVAYLFYSVKKYFTMERAYGIDHFDKNYSEPFVKKGIFRYTNNGMYIFGLMVLYLPGLLFLSNTAIIVALFQHTYIWVHYYFTERPDMRKIYGKMPQ